MEALPYTLVDRQAAAGALRAALERAVTGGNYSPELWVLAGATGDEKSALTQDLQNAVTDRRGRLIAGQFDLFQQCRPFWALIQSLHAFCDQLSAHAPEAERDWRQRLQAALSEKNGLPPSALDGIPYLNGLATGLHPSFPEYWSFKALYLRFVRAVCVPDHPLVLWLDDLHLVNPAALALIGMLLTAPNVRCLLIVATAPEEDADPATNDSPSAQPPLAHFRARLPAGRMHMLHFASARQEPVERPAQQFERLSDATRTLLQHISCMGRHIDLAMLETILIAGGITGVVQHGDVKTLLAPAAKAGLVQFSTGQPVFSAFTQPAGPTGRVPLSVESDLTPPKGNSAAMLTVVNFADSRTHAMVYASMAEAVRAQNHLALGRSMYLVHNQGRAPLPLTAVAEQYNMGADLVDSLDEKNLLVQINRMAAEVAQTEGAPEGALYCLNAACALLPLTCWQTLYALTLQVYQQAATAALACGQLELAESRAQAILDHAHSGLDMAAAYVARIRILTLRRQMRAAITTGLEALKLLGESLVEAPPSPDLLASALDELPDMTAPDKLAALQLLSALLAPLYTCDVQRLQHVLYTMIRLCVRHGLSAQAAPAYALYGMVRSVIDGDVVVGYEFVQLALRLAERYQAPLVECNSLPTGSFSAIFLQLSEPVARSLSPIRELMQFALESDSRECVGLVTVADALFGLLSGLPLAHARTELDSYALLLQGRQPAVVFDSIAVWGQLIANLVDARRPSPLLQGVWFDEPTALLELQAQEQVGTLFHVWLVKSMLCLFARDHSGAVAAIQQAELYGAQVLSPAAQLQFAFYSSLALLGMCYRVALSGAAGFDRHAALEKVEDNWHLLSQWAEYAPAAFQHKVALVEAEQARLNGQHWQAAGYYEQAIQGARRSGYVHEEALACELAAEFYLGNRMTTPAAAYLEQARAGYLRWQADAKVRHIEELYASWLAPSPPAPHLLQRTAQIAEGERAAPSTPNWMQVMRASLAMARELDLDSLLTLFMRILLDHTGARHGVLVLQKDGLWTIGAEGYSRPEPVVTLPASPLLSHNSTTGAPILATTLVQHVIRTRTTVVLDVPARRGDFVHDPYLAHKQPQSVLCTPVVNQGNLVGVLYLENEQAQGEFSSERLEVVNLLLVQAAAALENATLYEQVRELAALRKQVQTALRASEERYRSLFNGTPMMMQTVNPSGYLLTVNDYWLDMMGYTRAEIIGRSVFDFFTPESQQLLRSLLAFQHNQNMMLKNVECQMVKRAGERIDVLMSAVAKRNPTGRVTYHLAFGVDVTDWKRTEQELARYRRHLEDLVEERTSELLAANRRLQDEVAERQHAEQELRASQRFLQSTLDALWARITILDDSGKIVAVNELWHAKQEPADQSEEPSPWSQFQVGENYLSLLEAGTGPFHAASQEVAAGLRALILGRRTVFAKEYMLPAMSQKQEKNENQWYELRATRFQHGDSIHLVLVHNDITERKLAEHALLDAAALNERHRLARELHDSVTQTLYSISLYFDAFRLALSAGKTNTVHSYLEDLRQMTHQAMADMRALVFELRPPVLDELGLVEALRVRLDNVERRVGLQAHIDLKGEVRLLAQRVEAELYRLAQEAFQNVLRHAQAKQIWIRIEYSSASVFLTIQDDGIGFDLSSASQGPGMGLHGMRERVYLLGGRFDLVSAPGAGTTIHVEVPT
jgi:PAS domain S-box-containing protein